MALSRRGVMAGLAAGALMPLPSWSTSNEPAFGSCCRLPNGDYAVAVINQAADILMTEVLPGRGHDVTVSPDHRTAVIFARRPGRFALVLDLTTRTKTQAFAPPSNRHFYGHGFFSNDGRLLFATENDFDTERGVVGIYDATSGFRHIGEHDAGGIGPHEAVLLDDRRTIAIANGGIITHPDFPRQKLNLPTMRPSITLLDAETGSLLERAELPPAYHQVSIRHMAQAGDSSIWFGGQYEGASTDLVPLVGRYRPGRGIELIQAPDALYRNMNQYTGSVAVSRDGQRIAVTSPRGGQLLIWDAASARIIHHKQIADVCGVVSVDNGFVATTGSGILTRAPMRPGVGDVRLNQWSWDNHLAVVAV